MLSNIGRAAIKRIGGSHLSTNRFVAGIWQSKRVEAPQHAEITLRTSASASLARRFYATATKTKATQTASTKAKKPAAKKPATRTAAAKKPAKKPVKKLARKPAKKPARKPVKKALKAKPKTKAKAKPRKALTEEQKKKIQIKKLKVTALLDQPAGKPEAPYQLLVADTLTGTHGKTLKDVSVAFKALTTAELEALNHRCIENKAANAIATKKWTETHTPDQIRLANNARRLLRKKGGKRIALIRDDRLPTRPSTAFAFFLRERFASGDFKGIKATDVLKRVREEFKTLSPSALKPLEDMYAADRARYVQEFKTVFKHDTTVKA